MTVRMKKASNKILLAALCTAAFGAQASVLRIHCGADSLGAEISVNGAYKGECPLDIQMPAGEINIHAVAGRGNDRQRVLDEQIRIGDGVIKPIDIDIPLWPGNSKSEREALTELDKLNAQLSGGSLSNSARAKALAKKSDLFLNAGQQRESFALLKQVAMLEPDGDYRRYYMDDALMRGDVDRAAEEARGLQHQFDNLTADAQFYIATSYYIAGDLDGAKAQVVAAITNRKPDAGNAGYSALFLWLTTLRQKEDATSGLRQYESKWSTTAWPAPILNLLQGSISMEAAERAATSDAQRANGNECELTFYAGEKALINGQPEAARLLFKRAVDAREYSYLEYKLAKIELKRLSH